MVVTARFIRSNSRPNIHGYTLIHLLPSRYLGGLT